MLLRRWINPLCIALCAVAALFVLLGIVYFFVPATHLPSFLPGSHHGGVKRYKVHLSAHPARKRALLVMLPAALPLAAAWWLKFRYDPLD